MGWGGDGGFGETHGECEEGPGVRDGGTRAWTDGTAGIIHMK